jgi:hypothetical protein
LGVLYFAVVRKRFKGPEWSRHGDDQPIRAGARPATNNDVLPHG